MTKWSAVKPKAIAMRKQGMSLREVSEKTGVPRSTLSGWFKNIEISSRHKRRLEERWRKGLVKARKEAVKWHNKGKQERKQKANNEAVQVVAALDTNNVHIQEVALALLYHGEGAKKTMASIGNTDPLILKFFISTLQNVYGITKDQLRGEIHMRADQDGKSLIKHWSKLLQIPAQSFTKPIVDKRTVGKPSYPDYYGVCVVRTSSVAIRRRLMYISEMFCKEVANMGS